MQTGCREHTLFPLTKALPYKEYLINVTVSWKQWFTRQHLWEEAPNSPDVYRSGGEGKGMKKVRIGRRGRGGGGGTDEW